MDWTTALYQGGSLKEEGLYYAYVYLHDSNYETFVHAIGTPFNDNLQFSVGRSSGNLTVNGTVDRETFSRYFVTISVSTLY